MNERDVVVAGRGWGPVVHRDGDQLVCSVPVTFGHWEKVFDFDITKEEAAMLAKDERRYHLFYTAMHAVLQRGGESTAAELFKTVLAADQATAAAQLSVLNTAHKGEIGYFASQALGEPRERFDRGAWF